MMLPKLQRAGRKTFFSRLDFRTKLFVFFAVSAVAALWDNPTLGGALMAAVLTACIVVGVAPAYLATMLRVMLPFLLLMIVTHGFFNVDYVLRLSGREQVTPLFQIPSRWWLVGGLTFSREGLLYGANVVAKSMTFLLLVPLCVFTTDPNQMIVGLVRLRVPYKLAFVVSATLRFFPLIFDEIRAVMETQRLRGYAIEDLGARDRVRVYARIAVPVILGAMFKAQQIEVVLQARAFSGRPERTYLHTSMLRGLDWIVLLVGSLAVVAAFLAYFVAGVGQFPRF